jgi:hypothetical protein
MVPPLSETLPDCIVTEPPPQLPVAVPLAESPAGSVSVKFTPVKATIVFGLVMVKLSVVVPPNGITNAPNAFEIVGATIGVVVIVPFPLIVTDPLPLFTPALVLGDAALLATNEPPPPPARISSPPPPL